jgi:hypothetical protein
LREKFWSAYVSRKGAKKAEGAKSIVWETDFGARIWRVIHRVPEF